MIINYCPFIFEAKVQCKHSSCRLYDECVVAELFWNPYEGQAVGGR